MILLKPEKKAKDTVEKANRDDFGFLLDFDDGSMPFRERIMAIEKRLSELPQIDIPIEHHFAGGIYARTMSAPRGTCLTGKIYKVPQMIILSEGEITIRSEGFNYRIKGPFIYESMAGAKRFGYCHTDVVWTCLTSTSATNKDDAESDIYAETYEELDNILMDAGIINGGSICLV